MQIPDEVADDMIHSGKTYAIEGARIGLRPVKRAWFNRGTGHYVADCGMCFMFSDGPSGPWRVVPGSTPAERSREQRASDGT